MSEFKKTVLLIADVRNWAFDNIAQYLKSILSDKYQIEIIYTADFKEPSDLLNHMDRFEKIDFIHFFYRGYLQLLLEHIALKNLTGSKLCKFLSAATTTNIPDHLFIEQKHDILNHLPTFSFVDNYYTTSKILYDIYNNISVYPAPWGTIFDNVIAKEREPNFADKEKLVISWIGNSAWGEWHLKKNYDPKGYETVIVPCVQQLEQNKLVEFIIADGNKQKRSKEEIFELLAKTDILLIAATTDGTPLPLIEAMSMGCAIITTHNGIAPEVLPDIQRQFILSKDPEAFINAIEKLNQDRDLLLKLKQENFAAYRQIFANDKIFADSWSNLIEDSIKKFTEQNRLIAKQEVLTTLIKKLNKRKGFLAIKHFIYAQANRKYVKKILKNKLAKYIVGFFYSFLDFKAKSSYVHLKASLDVYNCCGKSDGIYALYPPMFPGVSNSTRTLFPKALEMPGSSFLQYLGFHDKFITKIAQTILDSSVKILIISGGTELMFKLVEKLDKLKGNKPFVMYFLWHGSTSQWTQLYHLNHFNRVLQLYKAGQFEAIITLKTDLEKTLEKIGVKSYLLQNFIAIKENRLPVKLASEEQVLAACDAENRSVLNVREDLSLGVTTQLPSEQEFRRKSNDYQLTSDQGLENNENDKLSDKGRSMRIGLWSAYANWVKNLYPQIISILMAENKVVLHSNFQFLQETSWLFEKIKPVQLPDYLPHNELLANIAKTDITLYVTNTECSPMIALESLSLGVPCLVGPTSALYQDDEFLRDMLTVNRVDCPVSIARSLDRLIDNYDLVKSKLPDFIKKYNQKAEKLRQNLFKVFMTKKEELIFDSIYATDFWTNGSGPGSHKDHTAPYRKLLQDYFYDDRFQTYIDVGCGDWQIMSLVDIPKNKNYIGYDIVSTVIEANKAKYTQENVEFQQASDLNDIKGGDLLIIKDVMIHWPNEKVFEFLENILPRFRYALITNNKLADGQEVNSDILQAGEFRAIDVTKAPFNLLNTELILDYESHGTIKKVYLYRNPDDTNNK